METRVDKKAWSLCSSLYEGLKIRQMRTNPVAIYHRRRSDVFIINFEHTLRLVLVFLLLTLSW